MAIRLTINDTVAQTTEEITLDENDYHIVMTGTCHIAHSQVFRNGTHVLTIKGRPALDEEVPDA